jgi:hypothetical protein
VTLLPRPEGGPPKVVRRILDSLVAEVLEELRLASAVGHPGESGRAREEVVRRFLRRLVPAAFGIDTGFVIDSQGGISRQIDIVIYRTGYHPVFEVAGVKHFMVESVATVIENKSSITSRERLHQALENVRSVKALDRTGGGRNYRVAAGQESQPVDPEDLNDQVFSAIMTEESLERGSLHLELSSFAGSHPRREWLNMYVDVNSFCGLYLTRGENKRLWPHPNEAEAVALTNPNHEQGVSPLLDFAMHLSNFLRVAEYIDFPADLYFPFSTAATTSDITIAD